MDILKYDSQKIKVLSIVSIGLVLVIHSLYLEAVEYPIANCWQQFTGFRGLSAVAVPLFYFISGLLFFKNVQSIRDCSVNIKKRIRSLLVPYIIWNFIFVGWYVILAIIPGVSQYVNSDTLSLFTWQHPWDSFCVLFIAPVGFQLWFLRDLLVYTACSPLLYWALKRAPWFTFGIILVSFGWIGRFGGTYFCLGAIVALHYNLMIVKKYLFAKIIVACSILYVCNAFIFGFCPSVASLLKNPYCTQVISIIGIVSVWGMYDMLVSEKYKMSKSIKTLSEYTFFVYLFHEPAFNIIKKLGLKIFGCNECSLILLYTINPFIMMTVAIAGGVLLHKLMPRVYGVLVGGR